MSALTILQPNVVSPKKVVLVEQGYPYNVNGSTYMPMAVVVVQAQLIAAGHNVEIVDFNFDHPEGPKVKRLFEWADVIGVAVIGGPYIPQSIRLCKRLSIQYPDKKIIVGGQIIEKLPPLQFAREFAWTGAIQIANPPSDYLPLFGVVPPQYNVSLVPALSRMDTWRLEEYLRNEFPLWLSQGCAYNCEEFCTADRNQKEKFYELRYFREALEYLVVRAIGMGIGRLGCYASNLDFFQNPRTVAKYLTVIAEVREKYSFDFRVRALSCLLTFLKAEEVLPDFPKLLKEGGFWRVGFGVDGSGESEWKRQGKVQNHTTDVKDALNLCQELGLECEVIMITGYNTSSYKEICKTVYNSFGYLLRWRNIKLRAYMAKLVLPGNNGWQREWQTVEAILSDPELFYNLEFNALASPLTNSRSFHRWLSNISFLLLTLGVAMFGRSISYPLLPQGQKGLYGKLAKFWNRHMPIVD